MGSPMQKEQTLGFQDELIMPAHGRRSMFGLREVSTRSLAVKLFITCWLVYGLHFATNTVREIYPALSLGDHFSFDVSEYSGLHPDIFEIPGRGAYINNNPGASIIGAIPYAISRPLIDRYVQHVQTARAASAASTPSEYKSIYPLAQEFYRKARERGLDIKLGLGAAVMQALAMAPLSALSVVVVFYILLSLTQSRRKAVLLALLYAFATPVFFRTAQLNQNLLVGHSALFAFALLWRPWDDPSRPQRPSYLLAGLFCGWAVVLDYSGLIVVLVLSVYAFFRRRSLPAEARSSTDGPYFIAGLAICAAFLMGFQWMAFGNPLRPAQSYMPPTALSGFGYHGFDRPHLDLLWDTTFGYRFGLFTAAPLLLLALYIPGWLREPKRLVKNREMWCIVAFSLLFLLFCSANQFGRLQFNTGVRHIVPVVPFLFLLAAGVLVRLPTWLAIPVGLVTTYWSWCQAMFRDVEQGSGVFESIKQITLHGFRLPWMTTLENMGYIINGTSVVPLLLVCAAMIFAMWRWWPRQITMAES